MKKRSSLLDREPPGWLSGLLIVGTALTILYFENKRPLRKPRQDKIRRNVRNLFMSVTTAATIRASEKPLTGYLMKVGEQRNFGLLRMFRMPVWLEVLLSVVLLDYTLFVWHYLTHRVPLLWRLHQAHHVDLDLDASTALRFHPVEMLLSAPWRGAQVFFLGISPLALSTWQLLTLLEIMFHHSNIRLPIEFERKLVRVIVTPRMHGIHHSIVQKETDSNWSTIFTWPDLLHGTLQLNIPQEQITIGVPAFQGPKEMTIKEVLKMPATADRPSRRPADNGKHERNRKDLTVSKVRMVA
ncbi:MAG: fatty acid hydroxylase [Desulfobulbaceae bacterium BRH_c16a]|nr:MAG: fatty acid hydroxylase [Desulfobulbaceae bacterium BRH_c16a]